MQTTTEYCPYCGEELKKYRIPNSSHFMTITCDCEGSVKARKSEYVEHKANLLRSAWERTGVPKRYLDVLPDYASAAKLVDGYGVYLYGPRGVGKTHKACEILKAHVAKNTSDSGWCSARFVSANKWLDSIQECYGRWNSSAEEQFQRAAGTGLLVIDDFGKVSRTSEWALGKLFRLVDERYNAMKPTIFTSKYSLSQLAEKFDAVDPETSGDLISRICEMSERIQMTGVDRRIAS